MFSLSFSSLGCCKYWNISSPELTSFFFFSFPFFAIIIGSTLRYGHWMRRILFSHLRVEKVLLMLLLDSQRLWLTWNQSLMSKTLFINLSLIMIILAVSFWICSCFFEYWQISFGWIVIQNLRLKHFHQQACFLLLASSTAALASRRKKKKNAERRKLCLIFFVLLMSEIRPCITVTGCWLIL